MSLLMQALKKAERAKQNAAGDTEVDRPSREFDDILALTPEPQAAVVAGNADSAAPAAAAGATSARRELSLDFEPSFSLEQPSPTGAAAASDTLRPMPDPVPPNAPQHESSLSFDLAPDPAAPLAGGKSASAAASAGPGDHASLGADSGDLDTAGLSRAGTAPAYRPGSGTETVTGTGTGTGYSASPAGFDPVTGAPLRTSATAAAGAAAASAEAARPRATPRASNGNGNGNGNNGSSKDATPRARVRAAAAASAEPPGMDPERLRLIGLLSVLALIILGFGYYYWQAVMAPGAGSRLPPVAMPPAGATGATGPGAVQFVGPAGSSDPSALGNGVDPSGGDPSGGDPSVAGMLAPSPMGGMGRAARADLERRLERTEQELAAAQQAIQAQANTPRQERLPPVAAPDNTDIRVARSVQPARIAPALTNAYEALGTGDLANAQQQYQAALRQDPNSRDALLGLATVAARQNQGAQASNYYLRLLELDPNDATAVAGLVGMSGGDTGQNERRLKAILTGNPEAGPVLFALGNLYAQQNRWPEAQQTYFRAYSAAPDNADYAYNLAIGLDRLNQGKLALTYYQRALALGQDKPAGFDRTALRQRMHELSGAH